MRNNEEILANFSRYDDIVLDISRILKNAAADKSEINALYAPLRDRSGADKDAMSRHTIANCFIINENCAFKHYDENITFDIIQKNAESAPSAIYQMLFSEYKELDKADGIELAALIKLIMQSDYSDQAKLSLIDAAADPMKYAEKLIELLKPVTQAFRKCEALYAPLLDRYEEMLAEFADENSIIQYFWHSSFADVQNFDIYPMIMMPLTCTVEINYPADSRGSGFIGAIAYQFIKMLNNRDIESEVLVFMDALANLNRLKIVKELSDGRKFGRELADELHLTTGSISQSLTQLVRAGLVKIEDVGSRGYCSIDYTGVNRLVRLIEEIFGARA